jgi:hypothetical protein
MDGVLAAEPQNRREGRKTAAKPSAALRRCGYFTRYAITVRATKPTVRRPGET